MLLLILKGISPPLASICIYIPLCFYLYGERGRDPAMGTTFTFHYASTYTDVAIGVDQGSLIYIPLCFYLYGILILQFPFLFLIYIPLCFYLYDNVVPLGEAIAKFTFHYASTYTVASVIIWLFPVLFTFHYASTYTSMIVKSYTPSSLFTFHYASTYTRTSAPACRGSYTFTFHYASTYTTC